MNPNDPLGGFYPEWVDSLKDEDMRPLIVKLGKTITDRAPIKLGIKKVTKYDPEYWAVATLVPTDELAQVCLNMGGIRKPKTFEEICKLNPEHTPERMTEILEELSYNGVFEWNFENERHEKQWVLPMFVPGSGEFSNMNADFLEKYPYMGRFFERMTRLPLEGLTHMVPPGGAGIGMHVIPVEKAIEFTNESVDIEHLSYWLKKYEGKIGVGPCSCRVSRAMMEEAKKVSDFGADVFGAEAIKTYLSKETAKKLLATIEGGKPLDPAISGEVAHAIKHWAMDRGATHYTHWFLPMTGSTAEKHDSFIVPAALPNIRSAMSSRLLYCISMMSDSPSDVVQ